MAVRFHSAECFVPTRAAGSYYSAGEVYTSRLTVPPRFIPEEFGDLGSIQAPGRPYTWIKQAVK